MRTADQQVVGALRELLDAEAVGMARAIPLAEVARRLGVHSRRCSEALSFLQAEGGPYGSVAGVGYWRFAGEDERLAAVRPEANRLRSLASKLRGLGWRRQAAAVEQLALELGGAP